MNLSTKFFKYPLLFICITFCNESFSQIYPTNFLYNGCDYTYDGLTFDLNDSIKCHGAYQLLFEEDFDGTNLDSINWQKYFPWGRSLHNDASGTGFEREYYSDDNVSVQDGFLHLTTKIDPAYRDVYDFPTYDPSWLPPHNNIYFKYSSGMIFSKLNFNEGKFEIRGKIPLIDGTWPAFWLYGNCAQEIDAFEFSNSSQTSDANFDSQNMIMSYRKENYCGVEAGGYCSNGFTFNTAQNLSDDFHLYSVEWDANKIIWKMDSSIVREVYRIWKISPPYPSGPLYGYAVPIKECKDINTSTAYTVFNTFPTEDIKMNIILNTAIASDRGSYPKEFVIDYVKAYGTSGAAITDTTKFSLVNIYPNPTTGKFSISQSDKANPITDVIILNVLGETINCSKIINDEIAVIDLSILSRGIYFAKVICKNNIELKKIIHN